MQSTCGLVLYAQFGQQLPGAVVCYRRGAPPMLTSPSVNEVDDNVRLEESLSACELSLHPGCWGVWWNGTEVIVCILILSWLCCVIGNVCGLPVGFQWSIKFSLRTGGTSVVFGVS